MGLGYVKYSKMARHDGIHCHCEEREARRGNLVCIELDGHAAAWLTTMIINNKKKPNFTGIKFGLRRENDRAVKLQG